ncbi:CHAT domain-containing protein [Gymnopilus junonius]|uniref:CHAT domain-containing protein n=1 Tax=Gymnopilus junonius TaxID=109634 RepID=A0A9P5NVX5_GYMJU|nr:CHAT domain-containing protein [Gymnopilus junonius]
MIRWPSAWTWKRTKIWSIQLTTEIISAQNFLEAIPDGHPDLPLHLNNIGKLYQSRYRLTGKLDDISEAISFGRKAVSLTPDGHASLPMYLTDLGIWYESYFKSTNRIVDLSESIAYRQKAIHLTPEGDATLPAQLVALGDSFLQRFEWTENKTDVAEAITCQKRAISLIPECDCNMPAWSHNLGTTYITHFECTGDVANLTEAIASIQSSIQHTSDADPKLSKQLDHLARSYQLRFQKVGNLVDLHEAISLREKAFQLLPEGHIDTPIMLYNLGYLYEALFQSAKHRSELDKAVSNYSNAINSTTGIPSFKLVASKRLAKISEELYPSQSIKAYSSAIKLVTQLASLYQTITMRNINLREISNTSTLAAAFAFKLGRSDLALEWLEQGRGLVWGQLNSLRTPLDDLRAKDPNLADDVVRVASALETSAYRPREDVGPEEANLEKMRQRYEDEASTHMQLAQKWDELLEKVRKLPDFEDFLQSQSCSAIFDHLPKSGVVVLINVHKDRCDALALTPGASQPIHIPLIEFSYSKALTLHNHLRANLHSSVGRMRDVEPLTRGMRMERNFGLKYILSQLWHCVVKPILDALGFTEPPSEKKRIWWCTTGPLSFLPIHAAGIYGEPETETGNVLADFAISSYTPTVRALLDRLKAYRVQENKKSGLCMISQPNTPGLPPIPKAAEEVQIIERLVKDSASRVCCLKGAAATVDQAAIEMQAYSFIHFACHANQDTDEPLKSAFALHDGLLELSSIIQNRLDGVDLAFLSACQTSTGDETLSEEAVHLAAGMMAAGYRGVVATMWSIRDSYAPEFAKDFYEDLLERSGGLSGRECCLRTPPCYPETSRKARGRRDRPRIISPRLGSLRSFWMLNSQHSLQPCRHILAGLPFCPFVQMNKQENIHLHLQFGDRHQR